MALLRYAAKFDPFLWRNPGKGRDHILPYGNIDDATVHALGTATERERSHWRRGCEAEGEEKDCEVDLFGSMRDISH